ncbi:hypothetical protein Hypma_009864 [Hypsizygus marmoreus]|uniref:Uncharacterized protein n=1 Tax=Hypsizygus marmoreus TaxID=39966 RepID=A0A369JNY7_HYPMA|nr:hypothetical protein Hypma_009864 [Hypsizygus marmoreus]
MSESFTETSVFSPTGYSFSPKDHCSNVFEWNPYIVFASNDLLLQFKAGEVRSCAAAGIVLILHERDTYNLLIGNVGETPTKIASFVPSVGLKGKVYPAKQTWVINLTPVGINIGIPLEVSISLTFKSSTSLWAFAYFTNGVPVQDLPCHIGPGEEIVYRLPFREYQEFWAGAADVNCDFPTGNVFRNTH